MSSPLLIRSAASTDFAQWEKLWEGYNSFYGRKGETALPDEITRMTWSRFFDAYEPVHALVAEKDGQLLGLVHYIFHRSTIMIGPICYLQDLFTSESARGQGVGRALIESVYERARAAGSPRVYWQTHETNLTAMKLYDQVAERSGFVVYRKQI
jgi:GNAT superfamily N-acetyltransferase